MIKQKPSNCEVVCPKQLSFWEYIFGPPPPPLPDTLTCRKSYKLAQPFIENDPRLKDPRYSETAGDVLMYTGPLKLDKCYYPGPKPKLPPPFQPPKGVVTQRISETIADLDCYCTCIKPPTPHPCCDENLCTVHVQDSKPTKMPFEEMRPTDKPKVFFTCEHGVETTNVCSPVKREAGSCSNKSFEQRFSKVIPESETCAIHEALVRRPNAPHKVIDMTNDKSKKLSKIERLKLIIAQKQAEEMMHVSGS